MRVRMVVAAVAACALLTNTPLFAQTQSPGGVTLVEGSESPTYEAHVNGSGGALDGSGSVGTDPAVRASALPEVIVTMSEYAFEATDSVFEAGVTYRFVLRNEGLEPHEWAVVPHGDLDESNLLFEVEEEDLPPGATVVRDVVFPEPGEFDFSCFLPGHYEAGMVLPLRVIRAGPVGSDSSGGAAPAHH
jgi:hypothetical protein